MVALFYTGTGMLPGRLLLPLDLRSDIGAWKPDPKVRRAVSNRLLSDVVTEYVPWDAEISRLIRSGQMPWRNVWAGEGAPLFANPETALSSPFTIPRLFFGARAWAFVIFLKFVVVGLGMLWLMRELGASRAESLISALIAETSGFAVLWAHYTLTNVFVWLPALGAAALRLSKRSTRLSAALVIMFAALATAGGHPETLFIGVVALAIFVATIVRRNRLRIAIAALSGFLIASAQLVTFLWILPSSVAAAERTSEAARPFRVVAVASQILPGFLGTPLRGEIDMTALVPHGENLNERSSTYIGFLTLLVLILAARRLQRQFRIALFIALVAVVIGWRVPGVYQLVRLVPGFSLIAAERFAAAVALLAAIAAGPALVLVGAAKPRRAVGGFIIAAGLMLLAGGVLPSLDVARPVLIRAARVGIDHLRARGALQQPPQVYEERLQGYLETSQSTALRRFAAPGIFWIVGGVALAQSRARRQLLTAAVVGELLVFGIGYLPAIRAADVPPQPQAIADLKRLDPERQWMMAAAHEIYPPNLSTEELIRDIRRYDGLRDDVTRRARLADAGFDSITNAFPATLPPDHVAKMGRLGMRYFLAREPLTGTTRVGGLASPGVGVYEIPNAMPSRMPRNAAPAGLPVAITTTVAGFVLAILAITMAGRTKPPQLETTEGSR